MKKPLKTSSRLNLIFFSILLLISLNMHATTDISLKAPDGSIHNLANYIGQGKWVVLNIWGTRCPPCREEMPELNQFHDYHKDKDAIVVAIAIDFPSYGYAKKNQVAAFSEDYLLDFTILLSDSSITEKMGLGRLEGLPTTYLFTPEGDVAGMQVGGITEKILEDFIKNYKFQNKKSMSK